MYFTVSEGVFGCVTAVLSSHPAKVTVPQQHMLLFPAVCQEHCLVLSVQIRTWGFRQTHVSRLYHDSGVERLLSWFRAALGWGQGSCDFEPHPGRELLLTLELCVCQGRWASYCQLSWDRHPLGGAMPLRSLQWEGGRET